jgi:hypothetical protein
MPGSSLIGFRVAALAFALFLLAQSSWLLLAELSRPAIDRIPTDAASAARAAQAGPAAVRAARFGAIRGDLWAEAAFTSAGLRWRESWPDASTGSPEQARAALDQVARFAPHRSDAWLLQAALAALDPSSPVDPGEALKMSYYTGPGELPLVAPRLFVATRADRFDDGEFKELVGRDLRVLFAHGQRSAIAQAYGVASAAGRQFLEQAVGEIDPSFVASLREHAQTP